MKLKPVIQSLLLVLGLSPALEVIADTSKQGQLNLTGTYGSSGNSYTEGDFLQPLWQTYDGLLFGDVRLNKGEGAAWGSSVGGGYRWLAFEEQFLFGAYGFYDYGQSALKNNFQQITLGGEIKTVEWTGRANYYQPLGTTQYRNYGVDTFTWSSPNAVGYQKLLIDKSYEYSLGGFDAEVGRLVPFVPGLTGYAGLFYLTNSDMDKTMVGPRLRAQYDLTSVSVIPFSWANGWVKHANVEAAWQYDEVRGNIWTVGVQFSLAFGHKTQKASPDITSRMTEYVQRQTNVVSAQDIQTTPYQNNGKTWEFALINSGTQFKNTLAETEQPDAYVIMNDIVMPENAMASQGDAVSTTGTTLPDGTFITGGNFTYEPGYSFNFTAKENPSTITAADNSDLFIIGKNTTITDAHLVVSLNPETPFYVISNPAGTDLGNLTIDHVNATGGGIFLFVNDGSQNSTISISNSTFDLTGVVGVIEDATPATGIALATDNNSQINASVNNNVLTFGDGVLNAIGIMFKNTSGTQTITSFNGNKVNFGNEAGNGNDSGNGSVAGIAFANFGTQTIISADTNTVNFGDNAGSNGGLAEGIYFVNQSGAQTIISANSNTMNFGDNAGSNDGLAGGLYFFNNRGTVTINSINNNNITNTIEENGITIISTGNFTLRINNGSVNPVINQELQQTALSEANNDASVTIYSTLPIIMYD